MAFLNALKKTKTGQFDAVIENSAGVEFARVQQTGGTTELIAVDYKAAEDNPDLALQLLVKQHHLKNSPCTTALDIGDYQLLMVEAPNVPHDELKAAVRWQIKDLIDFHIDDAVIDVFDAPASPSRGQQQMYVVVAKQDTVQQKSEHLIATGIDLNVIDIPELILRNFASLMPASEQGVALVFLSRNNGVIALCRENILYLARHIELGYEALQEALADNQEFVLDNMALEVQRSLDYYDRYFQQAPISQLMLVPTPVDLPGFHKSMQSNLGLESRDLPLREMLNISETIDNKALGHCALAIGAALRKETKSL